MTAQGDGLWEAMFRYFERRECAVIDAAADGKGPGLTQEGVAELEDLKRWMDALDGLKPIMVACIPNARDDHQPCIVPRSVLRRVLADMEYFRGLAEGLGHRARIDVEPVTGKTPGDRLDEAEAHIRVLMIAGHITEDEDLDD